MVASVGEQIEALESERARLERQLDADDCWRALVSAQAAGSDPEIEKQLRRALAANPYYAARLKIVEAITILRRLGETAPMKHGLNGHGHNGHHVSNGTSEPANGAGAHSERTVVLGTRLGVPWFGSVEKAKREVQVLADAPEVPAVPPAQAPTPESAAAEPAVVTELVAIHGITAEIASRLAAHGVTRYEHIAAWTALEVQSFSSILGLGRSISKDNWIEQAALLARHRGATAGDTPTTSAPAVCEPPPAAVAVEPPAPDASPPAVAAVAVAPEALATAVVSAPAEVRHEADQQGAAGRQAATAATLHVTQAVAAAAPEAPRQEAAPLDPKAWLAQRRGTRAAAAPPPLAAGRPLPPPPLPDPRAAEAAEEVPLGPIRPQRAAAPPLSSEALSPPGPGSETRGRSLRSRLLGVPKAAEAGTSPATGYLGGVEEASVEIVRPDTAPAGNSHREPRLEQTRRLTVEAGSAVARFLRTLKTRG